MMALMERIFYEFSENFNSNHLKNLRRIFIFSRGAPFRFAWRTRRHEKLFLNRQPLAMFRSSRAQKIFISRLRCCRARREKRPLRNQVSIWLGNGKLERKSHVSIVSGFHTARKWNRSCFWGHECNRSAYIWPMWWRRFAPGPLWFRLAAIKL